MAGVRASAGAASPAVRDVLHRLITCYLSKHAIESASGVAIVSPPYVLAYTCAPAALALAGLLPTSSVADITALHSASIQALSSDTVALVDAFDHDDFNLDSAVGACPARPHCCIAAAAACGLLVLTFGTAGWYDGDVYNGLLERAQWSPLNRSDVLPLFEKVGACSRLLPLPSTSHMHPDHQDSLAKIRGFGIFWRQYSPACLRIIF